MVALEEEFTRRWAPYRGEPRILVACSGGPDSVALVRLLCASHPQRAGLLVAHYHHGLRGPAADEDARFVEQLCEQQGTSFQLGRAMPGQIERQTGGSGIEATARRLRYQFLRQTAETWGARYLVTGHTADDQAETVLHHVIRGTGLTGLAGIPAERVLSPAVTLLRPMLAFRRTDIENYLRQNEQAARTDEHNSQFEFLRSRIRGELLPLLEKEYSPGVRDALLNLATIAADAQTIIGDLAQSWLNDSRLDTTPGQALLDCGRLRAAPLHLRREVFVCLWREHDWPLQGMRFSHWQNLAELTVTETNDVSCQFPGAIQVRRYGTQLLLHPTRSTDESRR